MIEKVMFRRLLASLAGGLALSLGGLALPAQAGSPPAPVDNTAILMPSAQELAQVRLDPAPVEVTVKEGLPAPEQFSIVLPGKDWQRLENAPPLEGAKRLAGFVSPQGPAGGSVEVVMVPLTSEVNPADWLVKMLSDNRVEIARTALQDGRMGQVFQVLGIMGGQKALTGGKQAKKGKSSKAAKSPGQAVGQKQEQREVVVARVGVVRSGANLFVIRCLATSQGYPQLAYHFAAAILNFHLENPLPVALVGSWSDHCLARLCYQGPGGQALQVPWPGRPIEEQAYNLSRQGRVTGSLHVKAILSPEAEKTSPEARLQNLLSALQKRGLQFRQDLLTRGAHDGFDGPMFVFRGQGKDEKGQDVDLFAVSGQGPGQGVIAWLITIGPGPDPLAWMRNKRAFEIVSASLRPQTASSRAN